MMSQEIRISMGEIMASAEMKVRFVGIQRFKIRLWLAKWLLILGAHILGVSRIEVDSGDKSG